MKKRSGLCYSMKGSDLSVKRFTRVRNMQNQVEVDALVYMQNVG